MFYVAKVVNGMPSFSANPVSHPTSGQAETEARRLTMQHPGTEFAVFRKTYSVTSQIVLTEKNF